MKTSMPFGHSYPFHLGELRHPQVSSLPAQQFGYVMAQGSTPSLVRLIPGTDEIIPTSSSTSSRLDGRSRHRRRRAPTCARRSRSPLTSYTTSVRGPWDPQRLIGIPARQASHGQASVSVMSTVVGGGHVPRHWTKRPRCFAVPVHHVLTPPRARVERDGGDPRAAVAARSAGRRRCSGDADAESTSTRAPSSDMTTRGARRVSRRQRGRLARPGHEECRGSRGSVRRQEVPLRRGTPCRWDAVRAHAPGSYSARRV